MNPHERQQFDQLLQMAVDRYAERLIQRNDGPGPARLRLLDTPEADGVWLSEFVDAVFRDGLLDNTAGACFVLEALERRPIPAEPGAVPVAARTSPAPSAAGASSSSTARIGDILCALARGAFAELLRQKTAEELARRAGYEAVRVESHG
mgnify:CR=1 FL=1